MKTPWYIVWWLILAAGLFFLPFLGGVHLFDWDEINFAEIAREMILLKEYFRVHVNFQPFWEKPPLFFWLQAGSMQIFGVGEYAARFPNAINGILTVLLLFILGKRLYDWRFGVLWGMSWMGTILPHLYSKSGIIDPWFNFFIFGGLLGVIFFSWKRKHLGRDRLPGRAWTWLIIGAVSAGLAILTKGPVGFLIIVLTLGVYWVLNRFRFFITPLQFLVFTLVALLVTWVWFGVETARNGPWFVVEFIRYQYRLFSTPDAGHAGFPGYHFVVMLLGCFPASIFAIRGMGSTAQEDPLHQDFKRWMLILFWVVLVLFTIVKTKIVHYSSMGYLPLTFLASLALWQWMNGQITFSRWMTILLAVVGGLIALAALALPVLGRNPGWILALTSDPNVQESLEVAVNWPLYTFLPGLVLIAGLILGLRNLKPVRTWQGPLWLYGATAVFMMIGLISFIGRIERYSQGPAIDFFENQQEKTIYATTYGYRSFSQYFYPRLQPPPELDLYGTVAPDAEQRPVTGFNSLDAFLAPPQPYFEPVKSANIDWLLSGDIDRDVYISAKKSHAPQLREMEGLEELGSGGNFVFFRRLKPNEKDSPDVNRGEAQP